jgi:2-succinyl-5-enolpyruvyl-6-hydroxy-3-cyclohexene-1-carboxylate synthase
VEPGLQPAQPAVALLDDDGTPHGAGLGRYARAAGLPHLLLERTADLPDALRTAPGGLRIIEARADRAGQAALRARLAEACTAAAAA